MHVLLQSNKLEKIPAGAFDNLSNLRELYLQNNLLSNEGMDNETFRLIKKIPTNLKRLTIKNLYTGAKRNEKPVFLVCTHRGTHAANTVALKSPPAASKVIE